MLEVMGIDSRAALQGFEKWEGVLERVVAEAASLPGQGGINMPEGQFLFGITRALRPEIVIETGVAAGVSSCFFVAALIENRSGTLYSIDLPAGGETMTCADASKYRWQEKGVGWAIPESFKAQIANRHHLILKDVREALPLLLQRLRFVDLFFHDDLHLPDHMMWEYESVWSRLRMGGVLASHDVNMGWIRFCRDNAIPSRSLANLNRLCAVQKLHQSQ